MPTGLVLQAILTASAFVGFVACAISGAIVNFILIEQVNSKLPPEQQFSHFGGTPPKYRRIHEAYRRLYPGGRLITASRALLVAGLLSGAFAAYLVMRPA
jgi:hypothetical protein